MKMDLTGRVPRSPVSGQVRLNGRLEGRRQPVDLDAASGVLTPRRWSLWHSSFVRVARHTDGATPISVDKPTYQY